MVWRTVTNTHLLELLVTPHKMLVVRSIPPVYTDMVTPRVQAEDTAVEQTLPECNLHWGLGNDIL